MTGLSFSQKKVKTLDEEINMTLDSLSEVFGKKVCGFGWESYRGVKKTTISYLENNKEITKVIKTEFINTPKMKGEGGVLIDYVSKKIRQRVSSVEYEKKDDTYRILSISYQDIKKNEYIRLNDVDIKKKYPKLFNWFTIKN